MNEFLGKKNTIIFDDIALYNDFSEFLTDILSKPDCVSIFNNEIQLVPLDNELREDSYFPCVTLVIINNGIFDKSSDSLQIQNSTLFTTEINVFTSGKDRRINNMRLANIILQNMQSQFGLHFIQNNEIISPSSKIARRILRATNTIDNVNRIIN